MKLLLLTCLTTLLSIHAVAQTSISPLECSPVFLHGVASGDPLSDAVIIWTRVTPDDFLLPVPVSYKVALDTGMTNVVAQGSILTNASKDFTVKVDVTGLQPDTYYYYEFKTDDLLSPRGRTKTAPVGDVDSLRFAVVSCANLEAGFFNVYKVIEERNDVEAVLMLGDYIYEYEEGGYSPNTNVDRIFDPTHETISLDDYRLRYSVYRMDHSLQRLHQNFPWICVWDDHESANDSYMHGAENHNPGEGDWQVRKEMAQQAYFEWLPIRPKVTGSYEIYRKFSYGDLLDLIMVDTRLQGREEQVGSTTPQYNDPNRTMLGSDQFTWLKDELSDSEAQWKVLGNQVIVAPVNVFGTPINTDSWDGYPAERDNLFDHIQANDIENFVVITGDVHTSWAFELEGPTENIGVEFVTPSVTSPGLPINVGSVLTIENTHLKFVELTKKGFILLDLNKTRAQADWFYVQTIDQISSQYNWAKSFYTLDETSELVETQTVSMPHTKYDVEKAPICPRIEDEGSTAGIEDVQFQAIGLYPNPVSTNLNFLFSTELQGGIVVEVIDMTGSVVKSTEVEDSGAKLKVATFDVSDLRPGTYTLRSSGDRPLMVRFIKQ